MWLDSVASWPQEIMMRTGSHQRSRSALSALLAAGAVLTAHRSDPMRRPLACVWTLPGCASFRDKREPRHKFAILLPHVAACPCGHAQ